MINKKSRNSMREVRHARIRTHLCGTSEIPRLNVFRSNTAIYAQVIDDESSTTLVSAFAIAPKKSVAASSSETSAATTSTGKIILPLAFSSNPFAKSTKSSSHFDLPTSRPWALKKV